MHELVVEQRQEGMEVRAEGELRVGRDSGAPTKGCRRCNINSEDIQTTSELFKSPWETFN
jgi:hypothetical protein